MCPIVIRCDSTLTHAGGHLSAELRECVVTLRAEVEAACKARDAATAACAEAEARAARAEALAEATSTDVQALKVKVVELADALRRAQRAATEAADRESAVEARASAAVTEASADAARARADAERFKVERDALKVELFDTQRAKVRSRS